MLVTHLVFTFRSLQPDPYHHQSFISFPTQVFLCARYYVYLAHSYLKSWTWLRYLTKTPAGFSASYRENSAIIKTFYASQASSRRCILDSHIHKDGLNRGLFLPSFSQPRFSAAALTFGQPNCLSLCPNHACTFKLIILYNIKTLSPFVSANVTLVFLYSFPLRILAVVANLCLLPIWWL